MVDWIHVTCKNLESHIKPTQHFAEILAPLAFEVLAHKEYLWLNGMSGGSNAREGLDVQLLYTVTISSTKFRQQIFVRLVKTDCNVRF